MNARRRRRPLRRAVTAGEHGGIAVLGLATAAGTAVVALVAVVALADLAVTSGRAGTAADAAALAAVGAHPLAGGDGDAAAAAERYAEANGARVTGLDVDGIRATATVDAAPQTALTRAVVPAVASQATAELVPPGS